MKLAKYQQWILDYLRKEYLVISIDHPVRGLDGFVSPTTLGRKYGEAHGMRNTHSALVSLVCKRLVELGLIERNKYGHYRYIYNPEDFPCYYCRSRNPNNSDPCPYAWDEWNRNTHILDCLGSK